MQTAENSKKPLKAEFAFNLVTGKVRKLNNTELTKEEIYVWNEPKTNCKKCYGRGFIGNDAITYIKISCKCLYKNQPSIADLMTEYLNEKSNSNVNENKGEK